jgi:hypothetical protein
VGCADTTLTKVAAHSSDSVWAVGPRDREGTDRAISERWNGTERKVVAYPNVGVGENGVQDVGAIPGQNSAGPSGITSTTTGTTPS